MEPGRELDALIAEKVRWSTAKIDPNSPRPYLCTLCGGSNHFVSGKEKRRICRPCHKAAGDRWRKANPEKHNRLARLPEYRKQFRVYRKKWALKNRYGITLEQYEAMAESQGSVCLICKGNQSAHRSLVVDHCHKSGKIRGLLCDPCNIGLANFRDNPESLIRAAEYLRPLLTPSVSPR